MSRRINPKWYIVIVAFLAMIIVLIFAVVIPLGLFKSPLISESFTEPVNSRTPPKSFNNIVIDRDGSYTIYVSIKGGNVITDTDLLNENNGVVHKPGTGSVSTSRGSYYLKAGVYTMMFTFYSDDEEETTDVDIQFSIK